MAKDDVQLFMMKVNRHTVQSFNTLAEFAVCLSNASYLNGRLVCVATKAPVKIKETINVA